MPDPSAPSRRQAYIAGFTVLAAVTLLGFASPFLPAAWTNGFGPWLAAVRSAPWAPFAAIAAYVAFATVGAPQIVLITALVAAFGAWAGFFYAWTGKMIACCVGFFVGRRFGAGIVARGANPRVGEVMQELAKRGFWASAVIRLVPTIPSVLVNIAAGAAPISFIDFLAGTAIGSVPKMALMAFGGEAAMTAVARHNAWAWGALALVIVLWVALALAGRRWLRRVRREA